MRIHPMPAHTAWRTAHTRRPTPSHAPSKGTEKRPALDSRCNPHVMQRYLSMCGRRTHRGRPSRINPASAAGLACLARCCARPSGTGRREAASCCSRCVEDGACAAVAGAADNNTVERRKMCHGLSESSSSAESAVSSEGHIRWSSWGAGLLAFLRQVRSLADFDAAPSKQRRRPRGGGLETLSSRSSSQNVYV